MKRIGVIGSGKTSLKIASAFAQGGFDIWMYDENNKILDESKVELIKNLDSLISSGNMAEAVKDEVLSRIDFSSDVCGAGGCPVFIRPLFEYQDAKKALFGKNLFKGRKNRKDRNPQRLIDVLDAYYSDMDEVPRTMTDTPLGSKPSYRTVTLFPKESLLPTTFVDLLKDDPLPEDLSDRLDRLSKVARNGLDSKTARRMAAERVISAKINAAVRIMTEEYICSFDIDKAVKLVCDYPVGPIEIADLIGIDTVVKAMDSLFEETGDEKFNSPFLLRQMAKDGCLGRKTGVGFYNYK